MSLLSVAMTRAGEGRLDKPIAALTAVAAGVAVLIFPADVLENVVVNSGLPSVLSAAEPPLGMKARIGFGLIAAAIAYGLVLVLMRLLGRASDMFEPEAKEDDAGERIAPRVRRRDAHPDAPVRVPFSVARDMGAPPLPEPAQADEAEPAEPEPKTRRAPPIEAPQRHRRMPLAKLLAGETDKAEEGEGEERSSPAGTDTDDQPRRIKAGRADEARDTPTIAPGAAPETAEPSAELETSDEPANAPEAASEPPAIPAEPQAQPEPEPEQAATPDPVEAPAPVLLERRMAERRIAAAPSDPAGQSLPELVARLERAIERRQFSPPASRGAETSAPRAADEDATDLRLRSALENLKRFASTQN